MKNKLHLASYIITVILTLTLCAFLTLSFINSFDEEYGYFSSTTLYPLISDITALASVAAIVIFGILSGSKSSDSYTKTSPLYKAACFLCTALVLFSMIATLLYFPSLGRYVITEQRESFISVVRIFSVIGSLSFAVFTVFTALKGEKFTAAGFIALCASLIHPVLFAYYHYTDFYKPINSSLNILYSCFCITFLIFVMCECKILLGRKSVFAFASKLLCFFAGASISVSYIIAFLMKKATDKEFLAIMTFALAASLLCAVSAFPEAFKKQSKKEMPTNEN